jgi:hypothetical protein
LTVGQQGSRHGDKRLTPGTHGVGSFALAPTIEQLVEVVEVVLCVTVALPLGGLSIVGSHTDSPSVVLTIGDENVSAGSIDVSLEESGSSANVEVDVVTADGQSYQ